MITFRSMNAFLFFSLPVVSFCQKRRVSERPLLRTYGTSLVPCLIRGRIQMTLAVQCLVNPGSAAHALWSNEIQFVKMQGFLQKIKGFPALSITNSATTPLDRGADSGQKAVAWSPYYCIACPAACKVVNQQDHTGGTRGCLSVLFCSKNATRRV